jgi:hypothetical protein
MFGINTFSESPFGSLGSSVHRGVASISGIGTLVVTTAGQLVYGIGSISGTGTLTGIGGFTAIGEADINGIATVTGSSKAVWSGNASISPTATIVADGHIQGDNWTDVPVGSNIWLRIG